MIHVIISRCFLVRKYFPQKSINNKVIAVTFLEPLWNYIKNIEALSNEKNAFCSIDLVIWVIQGR